MEIRFENIVLRDMKQSDIADYVRWFTTETEWMEWDAPWEARESDEETECKNWTEYYESVKCKTDDVLRWKFEIEYEGKHIGWVSSYLIDENYDWISVDHIQDDQKVHRTIGIAICESGIWGKHAGSNALRAFIQYYAERGCEEIYTQTWSGNIRMMKTAEKLGFKECDRVSNELEVRGKQYDDLTFVLALTQE